MQENRQGVGYRKIPGKSAELTVSNYRKIGRMHLSDYISNVKHTRKFSVQVGVHCAP